MSKKIYITHDDDVSARDAIQAVKVALFEIPENEWVGVVELSNGLELSFNEKTKNLSIWVWRGRK